MTVRQHASVCTALWVLVSTQVTGVGAFVAGAVAAWYALVGVVELAVEVARERRP